MQHILLTKDFRILSSSSTVAGAVIVAAVVVGVCVCVRLFSYKVWHSAASFPGENS